MKIIEGFKPKATEAFFEEVRKAMSTCPRAQRAEFIDRLKEELSGHILEIAENIDSVAYEEHINAKYGDSEPDSDPDPFKYDH